MLSFFLFKLYRALKFLKFLAKMSCNCPVTTTLIVGVIGYFIYKKVFKLPTIRPKPEAYKKDYKKDVVYLYQFKRTRKCPNLSPFCMKVEVFCRAYKIPYEICDEKRRWSRNGALPFIELNGEHIADSDLIEMRLRKHFDLPSLSPAQEAQSVAITRLADNHLFNLLIRYKIQGDEFYNVLVRILKLPNFLIPVVMPLIRGVFGRKVYKKSTMAIGNFDPDDMKDVLYRDLQTIQDYVGDQKFLFGDKVTAADAAVFGQIASVIYPFRCCINDVLEKDFPKVLEYCERIRAEIYPNDFTI
ncbi:hypothetical protein B9Z55_018868 [Caenorhabditis nigoni]|uniref:GST C-terminal domain-containing protein n=2 Tax=Caenorhabditis nigoni TaxID=1611254 RepID=A0A2G5TG46_9PELO|nr:hypothetical protein B9Z55_018868 [Caenorhabditis nigoni]